MKCQTGIIIEKAKDEVFSVYKETGKTPRQLAEENAKLREQISLLERQLEDAYDEQRAMCERHEL